MSQNQLSELLGIHPQTLSDLERGKKPVSTELLDKLLLLRDIIHIPGSSNTLKYLVDSVGHHPAWHVASTLALVIKK